MSVYVPLFYINCTRIIDAWAETECCSPAKRSTCEQRAQLWPGALLHKQLWRGLEQWWLCSHAAGLLTCLPNHQKNCKLAKHHSSLNCGLVVGSGWTLYLYFTYLWLNERYKLCSYVMSKKSECSRMKAGASLKISVWVWMWVSWQSKKIILRSTCIQQL